MYILAFKDGHDTSACLLKDGEVIAACEEERFNRIKHSPGRPPWQSVEFCLTYAGIKLDDVDHIVYASSQAPVFLVKVIWYYLMHPPLRHREELRYALSYIKKALGRVGDHIKGKTVYHEIFNIFQAKKRRVLFLDHHIAHAASAYYYSGFEDASIVTWDGKGDATSVFLGEASQGKIQAVKRYGAPYSFGFFYTAVTNLLGFEINDGEYKVMGLAPYGKPTVPFQDIFYVDAKGVLHVAPPFVYYKRNLAALEAHFRIKQRKPDQPIEEIHRNIAASLQDQAEKNAVALIRGLVRKTGKRNICLAGGVSFNVKINKAIRESGAVDEVYVQPAAGDAGSPLGAVAFYYHAFTGRSPKPLKHLYLGPSSTDQEILQAIQVAGLKYERCEDIAETVATLLTKGKVVGWFQGRMEFGPRALGARSILADPRRAEMKDIVNEKIKFREPFRPFCPSILKEDMGEFFERPVSAPYMVMGFEVKKEKLSLIPAVIHVDGTARPQEVTKEENGIYYDMIRSFKDKTGVGVVMDTSLNRRGEPMVLIPEQAIDLFLKTELDALAMGPYLIKK